MLIGARPLLIVGNPGVRVLRGATPTGLTWLVQDDFTTPEAAPLASPRTTEPSGDLLTLVQVTGQYSISPGGTLNFPAGAQGNQGILSAAIGRDAGIALIVRGLVHDLANVNSGLAFWKQDANVNSGTVGNAYGIRAGNGTSNFSIRDNTSALFVVAPNLAVSTTYHTAIIMRSTGAIMAIKGGVWTGWHIVWVSPSTLAATLYGMINNTTAVGAMTRFGIIDLPANGYTVFDGDNGLASYSDATPLQGDSGTHDANGTIYHVVDSLPAVGETKFAFRMQDANNYWWIGISATGQLALYETVAGVDTNRGAAVGVIAAGDYIAILPYGQTIRVVEGAPGGAFTTRITYAAAANFETETNWEIISLANGAAFSDFNIYPEYLSGDAATALDLTLA